MRRTDLGAKGIPTVIRERTLSRGNANIYMGARERGAAGTEDTGATGNSTAVGIGASASARGHEKLSARPAGSTGMGRDSR